MFVDCWLGIQPLSLSNHVGLQGCHGQGKTIFVEIQSSNGCFCPPMSVVDLRFSQRDRNIFPNTKRSETCEDSVVDLLGFGSPQTTNGSD